MYRRITLIAALIITAFSLTGCFDSNPDEQNVPWSRPADWESGAPGFGGY